MRIGLVGVGRIGAFHAATLKELPAVDQVVVADADPARAQAVAKELGVSSVPDVPALLASGLDGFVIAAATSAHASLIEAGIAAGVPTFCEKPVALDLAETERVLALVEAASVPVHIGFQRRFDAGYQAARAAVESGELGFVHHIRANTNDAFPPHREYIPQSGGFFRDCTVHDFDIIRYVTGREVVSVYATGANRGETFFAESGDVDSAAALLTLDDSTFVAVSGTRYNGAGHDVRMELHGSLGSIAVGLDSHTALRSAEPGVSFPEGPPHMTFMDRFQPAYVAELTAFTEVVAGTREVPCTVRDALAAFRIADACELSRHENRIVTL
ncbi:MULTISPECIES: Gfo/Idh/MocA family oxidoreductase [Kribbella]|jgi:myo-inositol 2-dehydrogenase/D-chiro-inositol 1-dehydrogenase|uniref:Myo-inositol 2-dehydrogenase/D-chiro-inositol 1-dehydrogenase n=1 Tax=Kribbella pratensis TaxID=2512112 RepID=A0ABY2FQD7_9ACTN|nr:MULTISPECIES: Gfo/Idh/MocA family oxidoreductase [Kribbella]TDW95360.1 myo-inositol 2-dehydrogenase/D-chiro-inositol 1-dehydrogenase [Kribbella pratensis]TDX03971.1 myo-inositol 2-dehydrogenase/D-chiro-inositol 1-dehydrogenase [Kribbella sp. VKM Ac-2566]